MCFVATIAVSCTFFAAMLALLGVSLFLVGLITVVSFFAAILMVVMFFGVLLKCYAGDVGAGGIKVKLINVVAGSFLWLIPKLIAIPFLLVVELELFYEALLIVLPDIEVRLYPVFP